MDILAKLPRDDRYVGFVWDHPQFVLGIIFVYLWYVLKAGPSWMSKRRAYNLKWATRVFNLSQVIANLWFSYHTITIAWRHYPKGHFSFGCIPPSKMAELDSKTDSDMIVFAGLVYFWVRLFDLLDTVFFVLAKKESHVSFLHVYHHAVVVLTFYLYLRSGWWPSLFYAGVINSIVHIVMYTYYFLSTFPGLRPYLWWKKYLTAMQIMQFSILALQLSWNTVFNCGYPVAVCQYNLVQAFIFLTLFTQFYVENYKLGKKTV
ncbi:elongation of very long chain fatty acids protein 5 [Galendromus occidentalis]|uniref:Elongation of very long chain fatty acids protein n=1 Tax=Galendromus occidentalis TaxID=34638 RepID=A0AAJ6QXG4_9ACAR|nr:elongation of very long chain fatty acids protein 5 [Galendromus occidentalis]